VKSWRKRSLIALEIALRKAQRTVRMIAEKPGDARDGNGGREKNGRGRRRNIGVERTR
jgi:hypothetical protein